MPVVAVGLITEPGDAEAIVATGDAEMVALARAMLMIRAGHGTPPPNSAHRCSPPMSTLGHNLARSAIYCAVGDRIAFPKGAFVRLRRKS